LLLFISVMKANARARAIDRLASAGACAAAFAVMAWPRAAAAQASPSSAPSASASPPTPTPTEKPPVGGFDEHGVRPLRLGVLGGIGFPRPLSVEALAQLYGVVTLGAEYGVLPAITIDGVRASLWSLAGDVRVSPFRGAFSAFFVGMRFGHQHAGADTTVTIPMLGSAGETLGLDSWFVNPRVGFLWTWRPGLAVGIEAGVQVPIHPAVSSTLPLSLAPEAQRTVTTLGNTVLPTVDLLRVGLLL
jgi:hypothetical protein